MNEPRPYLPIARYDPSVPTIRIGSQWGEPDEAIAHPVPELFGNGHMAVYGGTGQGKSKWAEGQLRQLMLTPNSPGGAVFDPAGDLVDNLTLFVKEHSSEFDKRFHDNFHVVDLAGKYAFAVDPFDPIYYQGLHPKRRRAWIEAQARRVALGIIRMNGEYSFRGMPTLQRYMIALLTAAGTPIDERGTHLPLCDMHILYDPKHGDHPDLYDVIGPRLSEKVLANWNEIRSLHSDKHADDLRSTINRFDAFFSELVAPIFSCSAPSINLPEIIENGGWLLVNLAEPPEAHDGQANAVGSILLRTIIGIAKGKTDIAHRRDFILWIDEASNYIGPDILKTLRQDRKFKLSCCLCVQDLKALDTEQEQMSDAVISLCKTQITFQQKSGYDMERLSYVFALPNYSLEPLVHYSNLQTGYEKEVLNEVHEGVEQTNAEIAGTVESTDRRFAASKANIHGSVHDKTKGSSKGGYQSQTKEELIVHEQADTTEAGIDQHRDVAVRHGIEHSAQQELSARFTTQRAYADEFSLANAASKEIQQQHGYEESDKTGQRSGTKVGDSDKKQATTEHNRDYSHSSITEPGRWLDKEQRVYSDRESGRRSTSEESSFEQSNDTSHEQASTHKSSHALALTDTITSGELTRDTETDSEEVAASASRAVRAVQGTENRVGITEKQANRRTLTERHGAKVGSQQGLNYEQMEQERHGETDTLEERQTSERGTGRQLIQQEQQSIGRRSGTSQREHSRPINPIIAQKTGGLAVGEDVQKLKFFKCSRLLPEGIFLFSLKNHRTVIVNADEVADVCHDPRQRSAMIGEFKDSLARRRSYLFEVEFSAAAVDQRRTGWFNSLQQYSVETDEPRLLQSPPPGKLHESLSQADDETALEF